MNHASRGSTKKQGYASKKTLDIHHNSFLDEFAKKQDKINHINNETQRIEKSIDTLETCKNSRNLTDNEISKLIGLRDEYRILKRELKKLNSECNESDYYADTGNLLFDYYSLVEGCSDKTNRIRANTNESSILNYFIKDKDQVSSSGNQNDRASLLDKFMEITDKNHIKKMEHNLERCAYCKSTNLNSMLNDGIIYCNDCFTIEHIIVDHDRPSYKDPPILWAEKSNIENYQDMFSWKRLSILFVCIQVNKRHLASHV